MSQLLLVPKKIVTPKMSGSYSGGLGDLNPRPLECKSSFFY